MKDYSPVESHLVDTITYDLAWELRRTNVNACKANLHEDSSSAFEDPSFARNAKPCIKLK